MDVQPELRAFSEHSLILNHHLGWPRMRSLYFAQMHYAWIWRDSGYWYPINAYELVETAMEWHGLVGGDPKIPKQDPYSQEPHRSEQVAFLLKEEPVKHCIVATIHEETAIYFLSNHHEITWATAFINHILKGRICLGYSLPRSINF